MGDPLFNGKNYGGPNGMPSAFHMNQPPPMMSEPFNSMQGHMSPMNYRSGGGFSAQSVGDMSTAMNSLNLSNNHASPMNSNQTEFNLSANEFVPKIGTGIHQSSSAPNFENYSPMHKPMHTLLDNVNSPVMSPSGSPQLRRNKAQISPPLDISAAQIQAQQAQQDLVQCLCETLLICYAVENYDEENFGGTTYFYNKDEYSSPVARQIQIKFYQDYLNTLVIRKKYIKTYPAYSMYTGVPPHIAHMKNNATSTAFFMRDEIKLDLLSRQTAVLSVVEGATDIPQQVDNYVQLIPLEMVNKNHVSQFGYPCSVYKAVNQKDGLTYCLRRIHGFKLTSTKCMQLIEQWKRISCSNIVNLREVFTTKSFNDNSIVFVYDFLPTAETLASKHFSNAPIPNGYASPYNVDGAARPFSAGKGQPRKSGPGQLTEGNIWSYVIQLSSALRIIHSYKLAVHCLVPTRILVTDKNRLRINCVGMVDVLSFDPNVNPLSAAAQYQREDLLSFGNIILALACNSPLAVQREHIKASLELVKRTYSSDLYNLIMYLLNPTQQQCSINNIMPIIGARFYVQLESLHNKVDSLEHEMVKECESGRLFRLQAKLNTILERADLNMDQQWSETGDRYLLKLFRDYVFHQTDENGAPWIDMSHVISTLNKLDAGVSEKICLSSRDEASVIIVSYQELKRSFESVYNELVQAGVNAGVASSAYGGVH